jgi:hypothetical protein
MHGDRKDARPARKATPKLTCEESIGYFFSSWRRVTSLDSIGFKNVSVYPLFVVVIERVEGHFCPGVCNDGYLNVSALLSKKGNEDA